MNTLALKGALNLVLLELFPSIEVVVQRAAGKLFQNLLCRHSYSSDGQQLPR